MISLMTIRRWSWPLSIVLCAMILVWSAPVRVLAQDVTEEPEVVEGTFEEVPEYIKTGDYDRAIAVLRATIEAGAQARDFETMRAAYLLLIKTYVIRGNLYSLEDRTAAQLYQKEARSLIQECLQVHHLRHTVPDPPHEYPPEMLEAFDDVRSEIFGSFRIVELEPADAVVLLDGEKLGNFPGQTSIGDVDIAAGMHTVTLEGEGYNTLSEVITISPGSTLEKSYTLGKKRGMGWWLVWGSIAAAGATGAAFGISALGGGETPPPEPLPGPPAPPGQ